MGGGAPGDPAVRGIVVVGLEEREPAEGNDNSDWLTPGSVERDLRVEQYLGVEAHGWGNATAAEQHGGRVSGDEPEAAARKEKSLNGNEILHVVRA